jgi:sialate O-acetylesterase
MRKEWGQGDFPFYWAQLADYTEELDQPADSHWAELREAQTKSQDVLPNTGQAVIIDVGEGRDIHPRNKQIPADRLARWALADTYGIQDMPHRSPRYSSMAIEGSKIRIKFDDIETGLYAFDVEQPVGFAIAGGDKQFVWADAEIVGKDEVLVWSDSVEAPSAVRYGWANNPKVNLYDRTGLPVTPFRTDDWNKTGSVD